jgi:hypothetical protein
VYWYLLESPKSSHGPRNVQRKLDFSSPALAVYHLDKLVDLGLVQKVSGEYNLLKIVNIGMLKQFMKIGTVLFPRYVLYATMFTSLLVFYLLQMKEITFYSVFGIIFGLLSTIIFWYETSRIWLSKPR